MARQKSGDKLGDIRVATVAEVVEVGSSAASVNAIAKRAGLAIWHALPVSCKQECIAAFSLSRPKTDIHRNIMDAAALETESYDKIRAMWFAILTYAHTNPKDFIFAEVIINAAILSEEEAAEVATMATDISRVIETAIAERVLRDRPAKVINTVLAAPALQLGRQAAMRETPLDMDHAEEIFALCWRGRCDLIHKMSNCSFKLKRLCFMLRTRPPVTSALMMMITATQGFAEMTQDEVRKGYQDHGAMAQFHRWYQVYELPAGGIKNALDILSADVTVISGLGTANGQKEYAARVAQLPDTWENAHQIKSAKITHGDDDTIQLSAEIIYQNKGSLPDGAIRQAELDLFG